MVVISVTTSIDSMERRTSMMMVCMEISPSLSTKHSWQPACRMRDSCANTKTNETHRNKRKSYPRYQRGYLYNETRIRRRRMACNKWICWFKLLLGRGRIPCQPLPCQWWINHDRYLLPYWSRIYLTPNKYEWNLFLGIVLLSSIYHPTIRNEIIKCEIIKCEIIISLIINPWKSTGL